MQSAERETVDGLAILSRSGQELSSIRDLDELLEKIMHVTREVCDSEASSILLMDNDTNELYFKVALGEKGREVKNIRFPARQGIAGWVATNRKPLIVNDVKSDSRHLVRADEKSGFETNNIACVPVIWEGELLGVIEALNKRHAQEFIDDDLNLLSILSSQAAVAINNARTLANLKNFFVHTIEIVMILLEQSTSSPDGMAMRIARTATAIAREMGISGHNYEDIYYAALLYNIGMMKLFKGSTMEETSRMHPMLGAEILRPINLLKRVAPIVESQLEHFDGTGYPKGLKGDQIPLEGRILSLAVAYEQWLQKMQEERKTDYTLFDFLNEMAARFDPDVVKALINSQKTA